MNYEVFYFVCWEQTLFLILCDLWTLFPPIICISLPLPTPLIWALPGFRWFPQMHVLISNQLNTWGGPSADPGVLFLCSYHLSSALSYKLKHYGALRFSIVCPQLSESTKLGSAWASPPITVWKFSLSSKVKYSCHLFPASQRSLFFIAWCVM